MTEKNLTILLMLFIYSSNVNLVAQNNSVNQRGRTSIFLQFGGPEILGVHVNTFLNNKISVNAGLGFNRDAHVGSNIYIVKAENSTKYMYVGLQLCTIHQYLLDGSNSGIRQLGVYFPIGYQSMAMNGFTFQIDVGPNITKENWDQANTSSFFGSIKIGITPKKKKINTANTALHPTPDLEE